MIGPQALRFSEAAGERLPLSLFVRLIYRLTGNPISIRLVHIPVTRP